MLLRTLIILVIFLSASFSILAGEHLRVATTTSTENSGLLTVLLPAFEQRSGIQVDVIAVGTGKALRLGENGDVDMVIVHAPMAEKEFVRAGFGVERKVLMHNDFVIVGPQHDPAGLQQEKTLKTALHKLQLSQNSLFVSRGDDSGTHKKEMSLWAEAGLAPAGKQYLSVGQGMAAALRIANDKLAYTLSDRGTYLALKKTLDLIIVFEQVPELLNPYHMIVVNSERHPHTQIVAANLFVEFMQGETAQELIRNFRIEGQPLFIPDVIK